MKHRYLFTLLFFATPAWAANTNAPIIIDANATAAYVNDGSNTNRMSPPVPGVGPLRSLVIKNVPNTAATLTNAPTRLPQSAERSVASPQPITDTTPSAVRVIDKRPLHLTAPTNNPNINSLDEVPLSERRVIKRTGLEPKAALSPAR